VSRRAYFPPRWQDLLRSRRAPDSAMRRCRSESSSAEIAASDHASNSPMHMTWQLIGFQATAASHKILIFQELELVSSPRARHSTQRADIFFRSLHQRSVRRERGGRFRRARAGRVQGPCMIFDQDSQSGVMDRRAFLKKATGAVAVTAMGGLATPAISQRACSAHAALGATPRPRQFRSDLVYRLCGTQCRSFGRRETVLECYT
jgi:hypothetical protein